MEQVALQRMDKRGFYIVKRYKRTAECFSASSVPESWVERPRRRGAEQEHAIARGLEKRRDLV